MLTGEMQGKRILGRPRHQQKDNSRRILEEQILKMWTSLRVGISDSDEVLQQVGIS